MNSLFLVAEIPFLLVKSQILLENPGWSRRNLPGGDERLENFATIWEAFAAVVLAIFDNQTSGRGYITRWKMDENGEQPLENWWKTMVLSENLQENHKM